MAFNKFNKRWKPSNTKVFHGMGQTITVRVWNRKEGLFWQLQVNDEFSHVTQSYESILEFKGWNIATAYWAGQFPEFVPFQILPALEAK